MGYNQVVVPELGRVALLPQVLLDRQVVAVVREHAHRARVKRHNVEQHAPHAEVENAFGLAEYAVQALAGPFERAAIARETLNVIWVLMISVEGYSLRKRRKLEYVGGLKTICETSTESSGGRMTWEVSGQYKTAEQGPCEHADRHILSAQEGFGVVHRCLEGPTSVIRGRKAWASEGKRPVVRQVRRRMSDTTRSCPALPYRFFFLNHGLSDYSQAVGWK